MRFVLVCLLALALLMVGFALLRGPADGLPLAPYPHTLGGRPQGHVYTSAAEEPADVHPLTCRGPAARNLILRVTHDTLLDRDGRDGSLRGALATSYRLHDDGHGCDYPLRASVRFSDGSPLTADDVLLPFELHRGGHLELGFVGDAMQHVRSAEVADGTLRVRFAGDHFDAASVVGENWLVPCRAWLLERIRERLDAGESMPPVASRRFADLVAHLRRETGPGTGPYSMYADGTSLWRARQQVTMVRHEQSWHRQVRPGSWNFAAMRVRFRDQAAARNALLRGELDWYSGQDLDALLTAHQQVRRDYVRHRYDYPQLGVYRIVWNARHAPFDRPEVRRALAGLVDHQALQQRFGDLEPARGHAKPYADALQGCPTSTFDPAATRAELRRAGFDAGAGTPLRLRLLALSGTEVLEAIVDLFRDAARTAGVQLEVRERALTPLLAELRAGAWDGLLVLESFLPSQDPHRFLHSQGTNNHGGFADPTLDALLEQARRQPDPELRNELWRQVHARSAELAPAALVAHPRAAVLMHRRVQGCQPGRFGIRPEWGWVAPEQQVSR
jgi:peptide/nickel transport system substrate-binding protein